MFVLNGAIEDSATAEISRSQVRHKRIINISVISLFCFGEFPFNRPLSNSKTPHFHLLLSKRGYAQNFSCDWCHLHENRNHFIPTALHLVSP